LFEQEDKAKKARLVHKVPKLFKIPLFHYEENVDLLEIYPGTLDNILSLDDGTDVLKGSVPINDDLIAPNREGVFSSSSDVDFIEGVMMKLSEPSSSEFQNMIFSKYKNLEIMDICSIKFMEHMWIHTTLCRNLSYLEGRRKVRGKETKKNSVFKSFKEGYSLLINGGSRMTKEKQIRFKVFTKMKCQTGIRNHEMKKDDEEDDFSESGWLTMSSTELKQGVMMFEKAVSIAKLYSDVEKESSGVSDMVLSERMKSPEYLAPLFILFEHRRPTSTTTQLNRYILHSMTGVFSDKSGMLNSIFSSPTRTYMDSYVKQKQVSWMMELSDVVPELWIQSIQDSTSLTMDYDRFMVPSLFNSSFICEFSWVMNDIYLCNLLQKESGFTSHRVKAIMEKTAKEERHFLSVRDSEEVVGNVNLDEFLSSPDKHHVFCKKFMMLMGRRLSRKLKTSNGMMRGILWACVSDVMDSMMMTSSLESGPRISPSLDFSGYVKKDFSFQTIERKVSEMGTHTLLTLATSNDMLEAVFSLFPKSQIGGPREILIQSVMMRFSVKFLEKVSKELCKLHEKEMLTHSNRKESVQSDTYQAYKEEMIRQKMDDNNAMIYSLNADASRWSPAFTMQGFCYFLRSLDIPIPVKELMTTVIRSFSSKFQFLPDALMKKWDKKPDEELEQMDDVEWVRNMSEDHNWCLRVFSGMGQGMLHYFSSLLHCAKDDIMDEIMTDLTRGSRTTFSSVSMMSSDDLFKIFLVKSTDIKSNMSFIMNMIYVYDVTNKLANIHTNWKKTAVQMLISEFNSYFSTGKRACKAVIKDVFTATEVVDMSEPADAVRATLGNMRRAMENGLCFPSLEVLGLLLREAILDLYKIDEYMKEKLMNILDCSEEDIPWDLGFLPIKDLPLTCLFGPEVLYFKPGISENMKKFYEGLFTAKDTMHLESFTQKSQYSMPVTGKFRFSLPMRTDKRITEMTEKYLLEKELTEEKIKEYSNNMAFQYHLSNLDPIKFKQFADSYLFGISKKYEFTDTAQLHSMIRALQLCGGNGKILPFISDIEEEGDLEYFASTMMNRGNFKSMLRVVYDYSEVWEAYEWVNDRMRMATLAQGNRHQKGRNIRFYTQELNTKASSEEIISCILSTKQDFPTRVLKATENVIKALGMNKSVLWSNPYKEIKNAFGNHPYSLLYFKRFLENYFKKQHYVSVNMMSSFPDRGSLRQNLLNMYLDKTSPAFLLTIGRKEEMGLPKEMYLTAMSLRLDMKDYFSNAEDLGPHSRNDDKLSRNMKLHKANGGMAGNGAFPFVLYDSYETKKSVFRRYTDLMDVVTLESDKDTKHTVVRINCFQRNLDLKKEIYSLMNRDLAILKSRGYSVIYVGHTLNTDLPCYDEALRWDFDVSFKVNCWTSYATLSANNNRRAFGCDGPIRFQLYSDRYTLHMSCLKGFKDNETVNKVSSLFWETHHFSELDEILNSLGWLFNDDIPKVDWSKSGLKRGTPSYDTMQAYTLESMQFNISDFFDPRDSAFLTDFCKENFSFSMVDVTDDMTDVMGKIGEIFNISQDETEVVELLNTRMRDTTTVNFLVSMSIGRMMESYISFDYKKIRSFMEVERNKHGSMKTRITWNLLLTSMKEVVQGSDGFMRAMMAMAKVKIQEKMSVVSPEEFCYYTNLSASVKDKVRFCNLIEKDHEVDMLLSMFD
jgi:hypothetical protein